MYDQTTVTPGHPGVSLFQGLVVGQLQVALLIVCSQLIATPAAVSLSNHVHLSGDNSTEGRMSRGVKGCEGACNSDSNDRHARSG